MVGTVGGTAADIDAAYYTLGWGGGNGMDVLREIKRISPQTKVLMMTSVDDEATICPDKLLPLSDFIHAP